MPELPNQSEIDRLYWHTDLPIADVATLVDLPARGLHQHATPMPAGAACYRCATELAFTSRSQRSGQRLRCPVCGCSHRGPDTDRRRHHDPDIPALALVGRSIIVMRDGWRDLGMAIEACIDVLASGGEAWDGHSLVVVPDDDRRPEAVVRALASFEPGVVAVHSLADLAATQTERLQVLFTLTRMRWRVIAAADLHIRDPLSSRRLDELREETDDDGWVFGYDGRPSWVGPLPLSHRLIDATAADRWGAWSR